MRWDADKRRFSGSGMKNRVFMKLYDFVKSRFYFILVISAEAGIQLIQAILGSRPRGSDRLPDFLRDHQSGPYIFGLNKNFVVVSTYGFFCVDLPPIKNEN
jgi:hypothetical protein